MQCPACRTDNPPQARFCLECAAPLARRCSSCGASLPDGARFCMQCAHPVEGGTPPAVGPAPRAYTPRHLAERIFSARADLEGERKHVTVMFADIKGSTELIEGLDPEEARTLLEPAVRAMLSAVHRFE